MNNRKKILMTLVALVLVCAVSVMGTLAYLSAQSETVTNTFVAAELKAALTLNESPIVAVDATNKPGEYTLNTTAAPVTSNNYTIVPGVDVPKDPKVTVTELSAEAYLFLEVQDSIFANRINGKEITWELDDSVWTATPVAKTSSGNPVYVLKTTVTPDDVTNETNVYNIIKGQKLTVSDMYGHDWSQSTSPEPTRQPGQDDQLIFNAYLCQAGGFASALEAGETCFGFVAP